MFSPKRVLLITNWKKENRKRLHISWKNPNIKEKKEIALKKVSLIMRFLFSGGSWLLFCAGFSFCRWVNCACEKSIYFSPIISFSVPSAEIPSSCSAWSPEYSCFYPVFFAVHFVFDVLVWFDLWVVWFGQVFWVKFWMLVITAFWGRRLFQRCVLEFLLVPQGSSPEKVIHKIMPLAQPSMRNTVKLVSNIILFPSDKNKNTAPLSWNSSRIKRIIRSTVAAETLSL